MRLMVDGDGSPVKEEVIRLGQRFQLPVIIITSVDHYTTKEYPPFVRLVYVDKGADRADYQIVKEILPGDILITQDYGLAALVLAKKGVVLNQNGKWYTENNINELLDLRYTSQKMRQSGVRLKGPKKRKKEDNDQFVQALTSFLNAKQLRR